MARALQHKNITTVQGWKDAKRIPKWRRREIEEAAAANQVALPDEYLNEADGNADVPKDAA